MIRGQDASRLSAPLWCAVLLLATVCNAGQVVVDHSFGTGGPITGPNYSIPDTVGRKAGNNLFHSFSQFDLDPGDVASFSGPANIRNIISRVTGGNASTINGRIQSTINGANFFLINPFGVIFGPKAKVDVTGSFAATTADYIKLADGGRFDARNPANDVLTAAPVSAFGFLGPGAAPITIQGPNADEDTPVIAEMANGKSLLIVGGDTVMDNVQFTAASGRIALISVGSAGQVETDVDDVEARIDTSSFSRLGSVDLSTFANLDVSGDPGGRVDIQAQNLTMRESFISSSSFGTEDGMGITLNARDAITLYGGTIIFSDASEAGSAGGFSMMAQSIQLLGEVGTGGEAVNIIVDTFGDGRAGDITVHSDTLVMKNGVVMTASTAGAGDGGNINIMTGSFFMESQQSEVLISTTSFEGRPGDITIQADSLTLKADSRIVAEAFGQHPAGTIQITAKQLTIDHTGGAPDGFAGISVNSESFGSGSGLGGGDIVINTDTLNLRNGARISSSSATDSPGGDIIVDAARDIRLANSEISAQAGGDGGNVLLMSPSLVSLFNSQITAESVNGNGGNITIDPQFVVLNKSSLNASAIQGNGGSINIVSDFFLQSESLINVSSDFGLQGSVTITAPDVDLSGSLVEFRIDLLSAETLLHPHCAERLPGGASSFVALGRGGVPVEPAALLPAGQTGDGTLQ